MLRTIDPDHLHEWSSTAAPDTVFYFRPLTGMLIYTDMDELTAHMINKCVVKITNIEIGGVEYPMWEKDPKNPVDLYKILPYQIVMPLQGKIWSASRLSEVELGELKPQVGSQSSETDSTVPTVTEEVPSASKPAAKKTPRK